jgi:hypothetical protein
LTERPAEGEQRRGLFSRLYGGRPTSALGRGSDGSSNARLVTHDAASNLVGKLSAVLPTVQRGKIADRSSLPSAERVEDPEDRDAAAIITKVAITGCPREKVRAGQPG